MVANTQALNKISDLEHDKAQLQDDLRELNSNRKLLERIWERLDRISDGVNDLQRTSSQSKDNPQELEKIKQTIKDSDFTYYRGLIQAPREKNEFWAGINWLGENGDVEDADLLMRVKRNILFDDQNQEFTVIINDAIKKIYDRDLYETKQPQPEDIMAQEVSDSRKNELFEHILSRAQEVLEDSKRAEAWLYTPIPSLNYQIPMTLLKTESGAAEVEHILDCIDYGSFA